MVLGKYLSGMAGSELKGGTRLISENISSHIFYNMMHNKWGRRGLLQFRGEA